MTLQGTPAADQVVDQDTIRALLAEQHPDLSRLPISVMESGWDNFMFRLGDHLVVRLPRRAVAVPLMVNEQVWLPTLAARLPVAVPSPLRIGVPGEHYPWPWSVLPWIAGRPADETPLQVGQAKALMHFLRQLHRVAPLGAPENPVRGVILAQRAAAIEERLQVLRADTSLITRAIDSQWEDGLRASTAAQRCWIHGDLHPRNVLVEDGIITGVIDWGDVCAGDVATDLASVWMLFDDGNVRMAALRHYNADGALVARAKAWAIGFASILLSTGLIDNPRNAAIGRTTLIRLSDDALRR